MAPGRLCLHATLAPCHRQAKVIAGKPNDVVDTLCGLHPLETTPSTSKMLTTSTHPYWQTWVHVTNQPLNCLPVHSPWPWHTNIICITMCCSQSSGTIQPTRAAVFLPPVAIASDEPHTRFTWTLSTVGFHNARRGPDSSGAYSHLHSHAGLVISGYLEVRLP